MAYAQFTYRNRTSTRVKPPRYGAFNEKSYDKLIDQLADLSELFGNRRNDIVTIETDHKDATPTNPDRTPAIERIGTKLFAAIPTANMAQSALALPADVILGAVNKFTLSMAGLTMTTRLEDVKTNHQIAIRNSRSLNNIVKQHSEKGALPHLYLLSDIYYPSARKFKETADKIFVELYTICAVRKTILNYVHEAKDLTVPKTKAYANIAEKIVPFAMNHNLSWEGLTEEQINDPTWVAEQTMKLDESMKLLNTRYIEPKRREHARRIAIKYSVGITKKHMCHLANG